jgi:hypothetical protein
MGELRLLCAATMVSVAAACSLFADSWPDRAGRSADQMLVDVVRWQQRANVKESTGKWAYQCFTDDDFAVFLASRVPSRVAATLSRAPDFQVVARALAGLPPVQLAAAFTRARLTARFTWRQMGFVDPAGGGQTEAGHNAELLIARAIVDAFEGATRTAGMAAPGPVR